MIPSKLAINPDRVERLVLLLMPSDRLNTMLLSSIQPTAYVGSTSAIWLAAPFVTDSKIAMVVIGAAVGLLMLLAIIAASQ